MRNTAAATICVLTLIAADVRSDPTRKNSDVAEEFFTRGPIPRLRLELTPDNLNKLRQNGRAYVVSLHDRIGRGMIIGVN